LESRTITAWVGPASSRPISNTPADGSTGAFFAILLQLSATSEGIMNNDTVGRYLARADACEQAASEVHDADVRDVYTDLARQWRELAKQIEQLRSGRQYRLVHGHGPQP